MSDSISTMDSSSSLRSSVAHSHCAACGSNPDNAHRIKQLEDEVRLLQDKATAAADKLADYEEEMRLLKGQRNDSPLDETVESGSGGDRNARPEVTRMASAPNPLARQMSTGRFSFLSGRKHASKSSDVAELEAALAKERRLREQAEKKVTDTENEIEDLSATLFEQANEMVSTERRAKAKLEEQLGALEQRDRDRSRRLDRIDAAVKRLERVKSLLAP